METDSVLLTGATGFIGHRLLVQALEAGYRVRCATRSPKGIEKILSSESIKNLGSLTRRLSWVIVPDITASGAYDEAVLGVEYIIHVASPVGDVRTWGDPKVSDEEQFVKPSVAGVINILESAAAHNPTLQRIVVTSSVVAIHLPSYFQGLERPEGVPNADTRVETPEPPYPAGFAYQASKIAALNESEAWMKRNNPSFDMISILAGWVWGYQEFAANVDDLLSGSNSSLLGVLDGQEKPFPINSSVVSVHDCAKAHLLALNPKVEGNQAFLVGRLENLHKANAIAQIHVSEAFAKGFFRSESKDRKSVV